MKKLIIRILTAKPIDMKTYRDYVSEENIGGLTLLVFCIPWSIILPAWIVIVILIIVRIGK